MVQIYTSFQTKTAQKHTLWGGTYLYGLYRGVPPSPGPNCTVSDNIEYVNVLTDSEERLFARIIRNFALNTLKHACTHINALSTINNNNTLYLLQSNTEVIQLA